MNPQDSDQSESKSSQSDAPFTIDKAFLETHSAWMLNLAFRVLNDAKLAEDAVQTALLQAHHNQGQFQGRSSIKTWLYRITLNAALAQKKKAGPEATMEAWLPQFDETACRVEEPWSLLITPDQILEREDLSGFVRKCVNTLPENYRIALRLRDFDELPVAQIAEVLEISVENTKVRIHRARAALKRMMNPLLRGQQVDELTELIPPPELKPGTGRLIKGLVSRALPLMITCQQFETFIIDYLEDNLSRSRRRVFEFHVKSCRECREYLAAYERSRAIAQQCEVTSSALTTAPDDLIAAVMSAL